MHVTQDMATSCTSSISTLVQQKRRKLAECLNYMYVSMCRAVTLAHMCNDHLDVMSINAKSTHYMYM